MQPNLKKWAIVVFAVLGLWLAFLGGIWVAETRHHTGDPFGMVEGSEV